MSKHSVHLRTLLTYLCIIITVYQNSTVDFRIWTGWLIHPSPRLILWIEDFNFQQFSSFKFRCVYLFFLYIDYTCFLIKPRVPKIAYISSDGGQLLFSKNNWKIIECILKCYWYVESSYYIYTYYWSMSFRGGLANFCPQHYHLFRSENQM